jgi:5-methylcytosine-specific restriction enzyme B
VTTGLELTARALFTGTQILAEHPEGMRGRDVWAHVVQRLPDLESQWANASKGVTPAHRNFDFSTIGLVKAGWVWKSGGPWFLTPVGRAALAEWPDPDSFYGRLEELYRYWARNRAGFEKAARLIEAIPDGSWASVGELATIAGLDAGRLMEWLQGTRPQGWYRVLDADGGLPDGLSLTDAERSEWLRLLDDDSVATVLGRADPGTRIPASDLAPLVSDSGSVADEAAAGRHAWLVRGSSVQGVNLVRELWLANGLCSLPASRLRELPSAASREAVRVAIESDYAYATVQERARMTADYYAFLSRMREGDIITTNDGTDVFLGVIVGPPAFVASIDNRANLQRAVNWRNLANPVDYLALPDEISARLSNPDAELIDLTEFTGDLELLLGEEPEQPVPDRDFQLPDITGDFAAELYMPSSVEWLQECVELLRDRPQLIFYGPPGTGKTWLAQALAAFLVGGKPENVQLVQFHPAYTYEDFFEGYRPARTDDGGIAFDLVKGPLRRLADAATRHPDEPHVVIIDEINRGNLAKIFGELYFLLEYRGRAVNLLYGSDEGQGFTLPRNLIILGTMNTADRSIALVDVAMRRRFWFQELHPDVPPVKGMLATWLAKNEFSPDAALLLDKLNELIDERDFKIGPSYLMRPAVQSPEAMERVWRTQLLPLLEEHHYGELDHDEVAARYGLETLRRDLGLA